MQKTKKLNIQLEKMEDRKTTGFTLIMNWL